MPQRRSGAGRGAVVGLNDDGDGSTGAVPVVFVLVALLGERLLGA
jgi:hypothetical protein